MLSPLTAHAILAEPAIASAKKRPADQPAL
jgi:hypothetical protein